jgi:Outer membrane protein beta-barrel family
VNETVPNAIGTWSADENVYAGYGMYTVTFDKLTIIGGVRVEGTNLSYSFNQGIFDETNALIGTFPANGGKDSAPSFLLHFPVRQLPISANLR